MSERFLNDRVELHCGDCRDVLATLPENSLDACVTDPPYHLTNNMGTRSPYPGQYTPIGQPQRPKGGFMGKVWDGGDVAFRPETWAAVYRVLKPGAHLIAMGGTRTYHRLACAIEDAGFEIRDTVSWLYGSGFPKSHDVSKGIDRAAGAERPILGQYIAPDGNPRGIDRGIQGGNFAAGRANYVAEKLMTGAATDAAREWQGWGTALKPAMELIVLARKPLSEGTVAANVLRWSTGALNINGCRVASGETWQSSGDLSGGTSLHDYGDGLNNSGRSQSNINGRWPANLCHDGSDEVVVAFPESNGGAERDAMTPTLHVGAARFVQNNERHQFSIGDSGSAARFFYTAKANQDDRLGSSHPTVKPLDLMQWLVRLITPPKGIVLDCFAGTGTLGEAAWREGMSAVLIEAEPEYQADIRRRMALVLAGPDERQRESIKAKNLPRDDGPLFGGSYELSRHDVAAEFDDEESRLSDDDPPPEPPAVVPRDDGPLFASRESWAEMWAKPFDSRRS